MAQPGFGSPSIGVGGLAPGWNGGVTIGRSDWPVDLLPGGFQASYHDGYPDSLGRPPELRRRGALHVVVVLPERSTRDH